MLPKSVRPHRILAGPLAGQRIVTSWHDYPAAIAGYTERELLSWFAQNVEPGKTWLDVGAHYGYTAIALCRLVGPQGRVFAFEPMSRTAGHLAHTRCLNRLAQMTVLPFALGASSELSLMQLPVVRGMVDSTVQAGGWHETFLITSLDWFWPLICGGQERIDGIKIDVQGMEVEVLQGMRDTLTKWKPRLVVEVHAGVDRSRLLDLIQAAHYSRKADPIEPMDGETEPRYLDNRSYAFRSLKISGEENTGGTNNRRD